MKLTNNIVFNLKESERDDWYNLCNDAEQFLFKVKEKCTDEDAIKSLERMILDLNNIRMEQYKALKEYTLVENNDFKKYTITCSAYHTNEDGEEYDRQYKEYSFVEKDERTAKNKAIAQLKKDIPDMADYVVNQVITTEQDKCQIEDVVNAIQVIKDFVETRPRVFGYYFDEHLKQVEDDVNFYIERQ